MKSYFGRRKAGTQKAMIEIDKTLIVQETAHTVVLHINIDIDCRYDCNYPIELHKAIHWHHSMTIEIVKQ